MHHHLRARSATCAAMLAVLSAATLPAQAQSVYKCTTDGKVSYGDRPCQAGAAVSATLAVPVAPAPNAAAARDLKRVQKESAALEKTRRARDAVDARAADRSAQKADLQRRKCAKLALNKQWADDDARRALGTQADSARLRATRAAEALALECGR